MTTMHAQPVTASRRAGLFAAGTVESFHSRDFDEVASLPPLWEQHYSQIERGRYEGGLFMAMTGGLMASMERSSVGLMIRGSIPSGSAVIAVPLCPRGVCTFQNERVTGRSAIVVFSGEELAFRATAGFEMFVLVGERGLLERHAKRVLGRPLGSLRRNAQALIDDPRSLRRRVRALIGDLTARRGMLGGELADPGSGASFEGDVCDEILSGLAPRRSSGPVKGRADLAWAVEGYLRMNLVEEVSIADLCRVTGASERTLHLAFREHIGSTPKAHRKVLLLNAARRELRSGRAGMTVTRVAMRWGFSHLGWFAHDYKAMFGETPQETLNDRSSRVKGSSPVAVFG